MDSTNAPTRLSPARIARAADAIAPVFRDSPQFECEPLSARLGSHLTLKVESINPLRSFKARGAYFYMHEEGDALAGRMLVCATAGNWGQAMAHVCRARGRPLVIYCAEDANPLKVARMRALGAEVRLHPGDFDEAKHAARRFCAATGAVFVEDGQEASIAEGMGTIGLELLRADPGAFDALLVPVGNGALITGIGCWARHRAPGLRIIGISSEGADAMAASWRSGRVIERATVQTIADGIAVRCPIAAAVADMASTVDEMRLVSDTAIEDAMRSLHREAGLVVEPAGAAGVAALLEHPDLRGQRIATVLCGSNLTPEQMARWLA